MGKPNYQHIKKQREASRKARQIEKLSRRAARAADPVAPAPADPPGLAPAKST